MNSELVTIFTSVNERNIETLAGILQTYKIAAEIKELNGSWSLQVPSEIKEGAGCVGDFQTLVADVSIFFLLRLAEANDWSQSGWHSNSQTK